jgi:hypothetical protein
MISKGVVPFASTANFANTDKWGVAVAYASPLSKLRFITCLKWGCSVDVSHRIPRYAQPTTGSDHHLAVFDEAANSELDMYDSVVDASGNWTAGSRYTTSPTGWGAMCQPGQRCGGAVASSVALMGGVVRPEEIAQGRIDHALAFTTPFTRMGFIACPAAWTDGKYDDPDAIPEGARMQLDPNFDVQGTSWPKWKKVIATALQEYGAYLVDTGGSIAFRGEADLNRGYNAWGLANTPEGGSLADLPWNKFRVLDIEQC